MIKTLLVSSLLLNLGLLLGRLSGFLREVLVASNYGITSEADIIVLMFTVPDLLVNILMGGAMGAALIPVFSQSPERAKTLLFQVMLIITAVFSVVVCLCLSLMPEFISVLAPGFSGIKIEQTRQLLVWVVWLLPLTVLSGATTAYLHAQNKFSIPALGTLIINTTIILGLFYALQKGSLSVLPLFILAGGFFRLTSQVAQIKPHWKPIKSLSPVLLKNALLRHYLQAMMAGSILLLMPVIARAMASLAGDGGLATFNYALKLIEFPLTIAISFVGVVLFPRISKSFRSDSKLHHQLIKSGVQITIVLAIITTVSLQTLSWDYVHLVYGYGAMDLDGQQLISDLITIGLFILPLQGLAVFLTLIFNARNETRKPMIINLAGLLFFIALINTDILGSGLLSLMWALIVSYAIICCLQLMYLNIENFRWLDVLFSREVIISVLLFSPLLYGVNTMLRLTEISSWIVMLASALVGGLSLCLIGLLNASLRTMIMTKLSLK